MVELRKELNRGANKIYLYNIYKNKILVASYVTENEARPKYNELINLKHRKLVLK